MPMTSASLEQIRQKRCAFLHQAGKIYVGCQMCRPARGVATRGPGVLLMLLLRLLLTILVSTLLLGWVETMVLYS